MPGRPSILLFGQLIPERALTSRLYGSRVDSRRKDGLSKTKRMQVAFAHHLLDSARAYPADEYPEVVIVIDNAP